MTPEMQASARPTKGKSGQSSENVVDLMGTLARQGSHLAQEQLSLVRAEMRETADEIKQAIAASLGAVVLGIAGLGVLLMGISYLVGDAIDDAALGTIFVGAITLLVAGLLYLGARKKLAVGNLKPRRSIETIASTSDAATGNLNSSGTST